MMSLSALGSCISLKVKPLTISENIVAESIICKKIDDSGELLKPLEITSEFGPQVESIFCFVKLVNIQKEIKLKWKWYSPNHKLFRESKEAIINQNQNLLEIVTAYDEIPPRYDNEFIGEWIVIILLNDNLIARKSFIIKKNDCLDSFRLFQYSQGVSKGMSGK